MKLKTIIKGFFFTLLTAVVALVAFLWWASGGATNEDPVSPGEIVHLDGATEAPKATPQSLGIMTFNIGYGRGPAGDYAGPWTKDQITHHLDGMAGQIGAAKVDIVAMQEVDLDAARSHNIQEAAYLAKKLGWPWYSCVRTWENNYVPFPYWPISKQYGGMVSGQCILSRYPIAETTRYRLPQPESNPWYYNAFYLNRAIDHVVITLGDRSLDLFNVHLEAFDVPNKEGQMKTLKERVDAVDNSLVVVLGDFNAPPPEAPQKSGFADEPGIDFTHDGTIATARTMRDMREVLPQEHAFTHPADGANRRLDFIFYRSGLSRTDARVLDAQPPWSDHLPIAAHFTVAPQ